MFDTEILSLVGLPYAEDVTMLPLVLFVTAIIAMVAPYVYVIFACQHLKEGVDAVQAEKPYGAKFFKAACYALLFAKLVLIH